MNDAKTKLVLIVEDNELNAKLFRDLLEAQGYLTYHVRDGLRILELTRDLKPNLILMDIQLPEISGTELASMLKKDPDLRDIPIIAVTAFAMKGDEDRIMSFGCDGYLSKPISVATFLSTVKKFLSNDSGAGA